MSKSTAAKATASSKSPTANSKPASSKSSRSAKPANSAKSSKPAASAPKARDPSTFPYETRLDVKYAPLEVVDLATVVGAVKHPWFNQTLCKVNDSVVRLGVVKGEYHWHRHDDLDEFFYCVEGRLSIDLDRDGGRVVELAPRQGFVVPKGMMHRTRAKERTLILMVEGAGIVPTGD
jgi:mannose-6-phosphate isomerase-like protein (cupin superfamily)